MGEYPKENTCEKCGEHIGWVLSEGGEMFALALCDDCAEVSEEGDEEPHDDLNGAPENEEDR